MRVPWFRCRPKAAQPPPPLPKRDPQITQLPYWATEQTVAFPVNEVGRAGRLTPAQQFRANGGRRCS
ncbi:hypothetical protein ACFWDN_13415 [Micromonospora chalcea]